MMKPWLSIDDQLNILRDRNMDIGDVTKAQEILGRIGYYRLSGYSHPFRIRDEDGSVLDSFVEGTQLVDVVDLYVFDKRLRLLALDAIERIELAMQVDIAHLLGQRDPIAHVNGIGLNPHKARHHNKWLTKYRDAERRAGNKMFVRHNKKNYGELPIWVAIQIMDFGMLNRLFELMNSGDQARIAQKYALPTGGSLHQWLKSIAYIRNISAHHERLWNDNISVTASIPSTMTELSKTSQYLPFRYFCLIQFLSKRIYPNSNWKNRFKEHIGSFPTPLNGIITLADFGAVEGWENWGIWK